MNIRPRALRSNAKLAGALVTGVSLLALSACGTASDISGAGGASLTKADFSQKVSSAQSQSRSVHVTATLGFQGQSARLSGDLAVEGSSLEGLLADVTMHAGPGSAEIRFVHGVLYVNASSLGFAVSPGRPWVKVDFSKPGNPMSAVYNQVLKQLDPANMTRAFRAVTSLRRIGSETVDGVSTTHYRVTVDTAKALRLMGLDRLSGMDLKDAQSSMPRSMSYDVWLDGDALPVRITSNVGGAAVDMHFSHWGEPVSVHAPPANQVSTFSF